MSSGTTNWNVISQGGTSSLAIAGRASTIAKPHDPEFVQWENLTGCAHNDEIKYENLYAVEKTAAAYDFGAGAYGNTPISDGGYIETELSWIDLQRIAFGLHDNNTDAPTATADPDMDFGIYFRPQSNARIDIVENGVITVSSWAINLGSTYPCNAKVKMEFDGTNLKLTLDPDGIGGGPIVHTSAATYPSGTNFYPVVRLFTPFSALTQLKLFP